MDFLFSSVIHGGIDATSFVICTSASILLGALIGILAGAGRRVSREFSVSLALIPLIVQVIVMLVNGNLGTAVAVAGAFSLVRFRSAPGSAQDIAVIFAAMATGLATGTGFVGVAVILAITVALLNAAYSALTSRRVAAAGETEWKITVPENLADEHAFDDLWQTYTDRFELVRVKTSHLGSLYQLTYRLTLKKETSRIALMNELRARNGNLDIVVSLPAFGDKGEL